MANIDQIIEDLIKGASRAGARIERGDVDGHEVKLAAAKGPLGDAYAAGLQAACDQYKVAFIGGLIRGALPLAGAMFGGQGLRAGLGAASKGLMGRAPGIAKAMQGAAGAQGWRGMGVDMAGMMGGQMLGSHLAGEQQA